MTKDILKRANEIVEEIEAIDKSIDCVHRMGEGYDIFVQAEGHYHRIYPQKKVVKKILTKESLRLTLLREKLLAELDAL